MSNEFEGAAKTVSSCNQNQPACHELERLQKDWFWLSALGIGLMTLGVVAIGSAFFVSILTMVVFGVLLLIGGVALIISSFWAGKWSGFLLHVLIGILYLVVGILIVDSPLEAVAAITLVVAALLIVSGLFRIVAALGMRFHNWGWQLLSGSVALLLGVMIYRQWPLSGLFVIGLFVGLEMIFYGLTWVLLGLDVRDAGKAA